MHLVHDGLVLCAIENNLKILWSEVADADTFQFSLIFQIFKNFPQGFQLPIFNDRRFMDQVEVGNKSQSIKRSLNRIGYVIQCNRLVIIDIRGAPSDYKRLT